MNASYSWIRAEVAVVVSGAFSPEDGRLSAAQTRCRATGCSSFFVLLVVGAHHSFPSA